MTDEKLNLTVMFNASTGLPHIIRSYQDHPIYGPSTYDLQVSNYTAVDGVMFPRRFQSVYDNRLGSDAVLEDFLVEHIDMNPKFEADFFAGLPAHESDSPKVAPKADPNIPHADILEGFTNAIWGFEVTPLGNLSATHPLKNLQKLWNLIFENSAYAQLVMEFEDGVIVADAPLHQTDEVIEWIQKNIKKPITHVWVSQMGKAHLEPGMLMRTRSLVITIGTTQARQPSTSNLEQSSSYQRWAKSTGRASQEPSS